MKKLLLLFTVILLSFDSIAKGNNMGIDNDIVYPPIDIRSAEPSVNAYFDYTLQTIEFTFNNLADNVEVTVTNETGGVLVSESVNTVLDNVLTVAVPTSAGRYFIRVEGEKFSGGTSYDVAN